MRRAADGNPDRDGLPPSVLTDQPARLQDLAFLLELQADGLRRQDIGLRFECVDRANSCC